MIGSKAWLLGASEGGVSLITEVDDREILDAMLLEDSRKSARVSARPDFAGLLKLFGAGRVPANQIQVKPDNVRQRRKRLQGLNGGDESGGPRT
jgi:flagellar protein FliO/FliZ